MTKTVKVLLEERKGKLEEENLLLLVQLLLLVEVLLQVEEALQVEVKDRSGLLLQKIL